ncbi:MAG: HD domain-containing phosphohydrolase [Myxococcaceae bacterium]
MRPTPGANGAFECLTALSVILDLANGLAEDKSVLAAVFAWELAADAGLGPEDQWAALLSALLRHLGCTAFASVEAEVAGDDIALRSRLLRSDSSQTTDVVKAVAAAAGGRWAAGKGLLRLASRAKELRVELAREACGAARLLAGQLRLDPKVARALDEVFERHDGAGSPHGWAGEEISVVGRVANAAHVATAFFLEGGAPLAQRVLEQRSGTVLAPDWAARAKALTGSLGPSAADYLAARQGKLVVFAGARDLPATLLDVASAFGDFGDLQSPHGRGHSRTVAGLVDGAAQQLGIAVAEREKLVLAAHLHDVGQAAISTGIWTATRALRPTERERIRTHVYFTERVLAAAAPLSAIAPLAAAHHERLDGSGYHRGSAAAMLSRPARLLAAADVYAALLQPRPHRQAFSNGRAGEELRAMARAGALDSECVEATVAFAQGHRLSRAAGGELTEREIEVLRLLALGRTNKQIAQALGISARTVQHHTIHIYAKLSVDTRAGAALIATRRGLIA